MENRPRREDQSRKNLERWEPSPLSRLLRESSLRDAASSKFHLRPSRSLRLTRRQPRYWSQFRLRSSVGVKVGAIGGGRRSSRTAEREGKAQAQVPLTRKKAEAEAATDASAQRAAAIWKPAI